MDRADDQRCAGFPRPLNEAERASLYLLLPEGGFAGVDEYRAQVEFAMAVAPCSCPCPTVEIEVDRLEARPSPHGKGALPIGYVYEVPGDSNREMYWLMAWADEGYLSRLEIAWLDEPPTQLPPIGAWKLSPDVYGPR